MEHVGEIDFVVTWECTLISTQILDDLTYITYFISIEHYTVSHYVKEGITDNKYFSFHKKADPEFKVQFYIDLLMRGKNFLLIPGNAFFVHLLFESTG